MISNEVRAESVDEPCTFHVFLNFLSIQIIKSFMQRALTYRVVRNN